MTDNTTQQITQLEQQLTALKQQHSNIPYQRLLQQLYNDLQQRIIIQICYKLHKQWHYTPTNVVNKSDKPLKCIHCQRPISTVKYAPHLEKCMGKGGRVSKRTSNVIPNIPNTSRPPSRQSNQVHIKKVDISANGHVQVDTAPTYVSDDEITTHNTIHNNTLAAPNSNQLKRGASDYALDVLKRQKQ